MHLRNLEEVDRLRALFEQWSRVVTIGAGWIGADKRRLADLDVPLDDLVATPS